ncbi:hypothetical protein CLV81_0152 [Flagellimonas meridianipacifica]|uniref:Uncharacterized protein n=1 Tax=Flagellimonas meridianipacifica TaxID=1080225 RepID=A0A2T0MF04_9FLAO|nr:hypothetical protein CLV81_0152 [Allomuricauda pacifica]
MGVKFPEHNMAGVNDAIRMSQGNQKMMDSMMRMMCEKV